ncbi:MAG: hypothetical protein EAX95_12790 [Candidatus Thorarchaeota archaeon]|nr:hypothetical protein [Candidatus Thorarchaeota archaeon]
MNAKSKSGNVATGMDTIKVLPLEPYVEAGPPPVALMTTGAIVTGTAVVIIGSVLMLCSPSRKHALEIPDREVC